MNIPEWLSNKKATIIKCNAPQENFEQIKNDLSRREGRLESFQKIAKPVLIVTTMIVAGMSATSTFANTNVNASAEINSVHQEIRAEITPGYDHLQKMAGADYSQNSAKTDNPTIITIVSKNDPNLTEIIAVSDIRILPDLTYHQGLQENGLWGQMLNDIKNIIKSSDEIKRDETAKVLTSDPKTYSVSQGTDGKKIEMGKLCFMQSGVEDYIVINKDLKFSFKDIEIKAATAIHELAHCQDLSVDETINKEILADVTASLLVASHTGNWDYLNHSVGALRILHQNDPEHASHRFLDQRELLHLNRFAAIDGASVGRCNSTLNHQGSD